MNLTKFKIGTLIRKLIIEDEQINTLIGENIFPLIAPEDTQGSFIIYKRDEYSKNYTKDGIYRENCVIYITVVSDTYDEAQKIAIMINDLLEGYGQTFKIKLTDSTEDYEDNKFIQVLQFTIN